jgi:cyclophilin family peptidyl-prolyl cis-trans isomerase
MNWRMSVAMGVVLILGGGFQVGKGADPVVSGSEDFDTLTDRWKTLLTEMRKNFRSFQYSKTDEERSAIFESQNKLAAEGDELEKKLAAAASGALESGSKNASVAAEFLETSYKNHSEASHYELAEEVLKRLVKHRDKLTEKQQAWLAKAEAETAFQTGDYLRAKQLIDELSKKGPLDAPLPTLQEQLKSLTPAWEHELAIRAAETKADDLPRVKFVTNKGAIVLELFENEAPIATANLITLVESRFYENIRFHRVLNDFMAQVGDPATIGKPELPYTIPDECTQPNFRHHFRGSVSMAKTAAKDSGNTQFFITFAATAHLDGKHTVFGRVVEGMDVVDSIQRVDPDKPHGEDPDFIVSAEVLRKRDHEYKATKITR